MTNTYILILSLLLLSTIKNIRNNPLLKNILGFILIIVLLMKLKLKKKIYSSIIN